MRYVLAIIFIISSTTLSAKERVFEATKTYERPSWLDSAETVKLSAVAL